MSLTRYGRWVRVETADAKMGPRLINLDNVEDIFSGPNGHAVFIKVSGERVFSNHPFEDTCLRVLVDETDILTRQPVPPISRDQLAMFPERAS